MCEIENNLQKRIDLLVKENNRLYQKVKTANRKNQRLRGFLKRHNIEFNIEEKCFKTRNLIIDDDEIDKIDNDYENNNKNEVTKTEITEVTVVSEGSDNCSENGSVEDGNISDNWEDTSALYE
jgi:hypothetical protein